MKKFKAIIVFALIFAMVLPGTIAFADGPAIQYYPNSVALPRISEHLEVTILTEFWRNPPREEVDNECICWLSPGDRLNFLSYYTDPSGVAWWEASIINCANATFLNGSVGYVRVSHVKTVVG